jgi:hypothetical protein
LRFAAHLPSFGWQPIVLTAHPRAFETTSADLLPDIGEQTRVIVAQAWDAQKHFAVRGWYPDFVGRPDRWWSWWWGAVPAGLKAIRSYKPEAIWSTYPIATAHSIGVTLSRLSGVPLVADFRDPMAQDDYPPEPAKRRSFLRVERATIATARYSTFTSKSAVQVYEQRYPALRARMRLLENGYDESAFAGVQSAAAPLNPGKLTLLHSGIVYPSERDPSRLFEALARLRAARPALVERIMLRFRASVHEQLLHELATRYGVADLVEISPPVGYRAAIAEMCRADALLVLQANNCNAQIPAKLYEYLRARRPMIVLADPSGDTAASASLAGLRGVAALEDAAGIAALLERFAADPKQVDFQADSAAVAGASRFERTRQLAALLEEASGGRC